ncbi:MAG: TIGR03915 family putative DNA repair protein [Elusimicrobiota bacterium]|jgi:probable DNA metabolism protein|nr:TIGR03915 family putative DNA repair protein [Elusimicrobiota bacterium]
MQNRDIIYSYDGSFEGFLSCVFESFVHKEIPSDIISEKSPQIPLFDSIKIATDIKKAERLSKSLLNKFGFDIFCLVQNSFFSCLPNKESLILDLIHKLYKNGVKIINDLTDNTILTLTKASENLEGEAHLYKGFVRFKEHKGVLLAVIKPKNSVLHILVHHFIQRLPKEKFLIYDETNNLLCAYSDGKYAISETEKLIMPETSDKEKSYQTLWKKFYDTIAIKERTNHKLRQNLMPKRYWSHLTEMK